MAEKLVHYTCEKCGESLILSADKLSAKCKFCGTEYYFKEDNSEALIFALNRANLDRLRCDFSDAIKGYKVITDEYPSNAEAHWGLVLSLYGIEYVRDSRTQKFIPTCHRVVEESILSHPNYLLAIKNAATEQVAIFERNAKVIDKLQKAIKLKMEDEEEFEVFISFKSKDERGRPTPDSVIGRKIRDELEKKGIKTFFSDVTLEDRMGDEYEPIIYKALNTCKAFILIATSKENVNAVWVKNEWSRFEERIEKEHLTTATWFAVFDKIKASDLPGFLSRQGFDLRNYPYGYEIKVADAIALKLGKTKKEDKSAELQKQLEELQAQQKAREEEQRKREADLAAQQKQLEEMQAQTKAREEQFLAQQKQFEEMMKQFTAQQTQASAQPQNVVNPTQDYIKKMFASLEARNFTEANNYAEKVISLDPENAEAYLGKLLIENRLSKIEQLKNSINSRAVTNSQNYKKVMLYGSSELKDKLNSLANNTATQPAYTQAPQQQVNFSQSSVTNALIKKMYAYISERKFSEADVLAEQVLAFEPNNAEAYLGKLMLETRRTKIEELKNSVNMTITDNPNYAKVMKYGSEEIKNRIKHLTDSINPTPKTQAKPSTTSSYSSYTSSYKVEQEKPAEVVDPNLVFELTGSTYTIKGVKTKSITSIKIPQNYNGKVVSAIANKAFYYCSTLASVDIPNTIETIGESAFEGCKALTTVKLPNKLKAIQRLGFATCTALKEIVVPNSVTQIGYYAFSGCSSLKKVVIGDGVKVIGASAFDRCKDLSDLTLGKNLECISGAFEECKSLTSVVLPASLDTIGNYSFRYCDNLKNVIFENPEGWTAEDLDNVVHQLKSKDLKNPTVAAKLLVDTHSDDYWVRKASTVAPPQKVASKTTTAKVEKPVEQKPVEIIDPNLIFELKGESYVVKGVKNTFITSAKVPEKYNGKVVTEIADKAFFNCKELTSVVLPESIVSIGDSAFYNCYRLKTINIPSGIKVIKSFAFSICALTELILPDSLTEIASNSFTGCAKLTNLVIGKGVTSIGANAFQTCTNLQTCTMGENVKTIGASAFENCKWLKRIVIPDKVDTIGIGAFKNTGISYATFTRVDSWEVKRPQGNPYIIKYSDLNSPFQAARMLSKDFIEHNWVFKGKSSSSLFPKRFW